MGLVCRNVRFSAESGHDWVSQRALFDTGATLCQAPVDIAAQLYASLFQRTRVVSADGTVQERDVVHLQGQIGPTLSAVLATVMVGAAAAPALVGAVAMEHLWLGIDPTTQPLVTQLPVLLGKPQWQTLEGSCTTMASHGCPAGRRG